MAQTTPNHTQTVSGWAAHDSSGKITPYIFKRRENGVNDVTIKILYCGICHTDLHYAKNEWGITMYPVVPGHEITGVITKVGSNAKGFKEGDRVGVGCLASTCLECEFCQSSQENYCDQLQFVYNGIFWDGSITYGGYSKIFVADYRYVVHIPENLPMDATAPLLCGGITVFSPLKDNKMVESPGKRIGGDGPWRPWTHCSQICTNAKQMQRCRRTLDLILDTVSAKHSVGPILELLKVNGTLHIVGAPDQPMELPSFPLIFGKRAVTGSIIGGIQETQDYAGPTPVGHLVNTANWVCQEAIDGARLRCGSGTETLVTIGGYRRYSDGGGGLIFCSNNEDGAEDEGDDYKG
ncbi:putative Alcohol dehydrogenase [Quillaja saponaria]|uniref:Alcohol dehydrogenase n=1 Tax=Quillaja saponaria TaxID=32244 RepID=A0AAD7PKB4_QUISA|nr:putative Alcohol dehydrogenase [Quillaja saponaria]